MDYYRILEIEQSATSSEINRAYKKLAKKYHPDKNMHCSDDATIRFKHILEAYEILSDEQKRKKYDSKYHKRKYFDCDTQYDVKSDEMGQIIHDMSVRNLAKICDVFCINSEDDI